ncbi:LamG-like jellyroll fold domain-containing protein [Spongiimicrobium salis]|uniref:LamG-like jellyroll fold domain-containing protein n=1 Tax=Spongiimicrobium salis TaxID=1667022 RepID=UPI00374D582A
MKSVQYWLGLFALAISAITYAQEGPRPVTAAQAIQNQGYTLQVGVPYLGVSTPTAARNSQRDIRFPWDVLYLTSTFGELPEQFSVSTGFYGDRVELNWQVLNNQNLITGFQILRREFTGVPNDTTPFEFVANVSASSSRFDDEFIEGGVLYEYKLLALGILPEGEEVFLQNFISGIGFRNPTAVVTGNISFDGGTPVQHVIVGAEPQGASVSAGSSILIPANTAQGISLADDQLENAFSLQAWAKQPTNLPGPISLFNLPELSNAAVSIASITANQLTIAIGQSQFTLTNFYPIGGVDDQGNLALAPISDFPNRFVHYTVTVEAGSAPRLYLNGVEINEALETTVNEFLNEAANGNTNVTEIEVALNTQNFPTFNTNQLRLAGSNALFMDEVRVWQRALQPATIATNYLRYIGGNDADLAAYYRFDEGLGTQAYDLSRTGFNFNQNHVAFASNVTYTSNEASRPTSSQFGVLGVTDENGNYEISAIPYSGNGESFTITPRFGLHEFDPNQQLVFLGADASVANNIDFVDISSFEFRGRVLYDSRGVFPNISNVPDSEVNFQLLGRGYNNYSVNDNGQTRTLNQGEFWLPDETIDAPSMGNVTFERYARIGVEGANVFIDGQIVLDAQNQPIVTDADGNFVIEVPIGEHAIEVRKANHTLVHNGRFPAGTDLFNFFQDAVSPVQFIDTTRVAVVGKVVGGAVEGAKPIGFGADGLETVEIFDENGIPGDPLEVSSVNNIGQATIRFGYQPNAGTIQPATTATVQTNSESGEYRINLLPLQYQLRHTDVAINTNDAILLIDNGTTELVNYEEVTAEELLTVPSFTYETYDNGLLEERTLEGVAYSYEQNFIYRSNPEIEVVQQTSDEVVRLVENRGQEDETITEFNTAGIQIGGNPVNVYTQFAEYQIELRSFERYVNNDGPGNAVEDLVPIVDGELNVTNNLALAGSERVVTDEEDNSLRIYSFKAGIPAVSGDFTRAISANLRIGTMDFPVGGNLFVPQGIILGGASDGSQTFVTAGPDVPDIILRDPPGSNSFAAIEEGTTFSFTTEYNSASENTIGLDVEIKAGVTVAAGGGLAGPVIESESTNNITTGISTTLSSEDGNSATKTYSFSQTIATSSDPNFVGADGDLYIGQSKNFFYGTFNNVVPSITNLNGNDDVRLTNASNEEIFISLQRGFQFVEEPTNTFFVFSQKQLLETVIPELEAIIMAIDNGQIDPETDDTVQPRPFYAEQIRLWRKVILENERSKFRALNDREVVRAEVLAANTDPDFTTFIENNFQDNISFDAGVGEFTRSVETTSVVSNQSSFSVAIDASLAGTLGFALNDTGFLVSPSVSNSNNDTETNTEEQENTTTISYTLQDNDLGNFLSVDVINLFDGNGPIFTTLGGRTSCPYEGPELSVFYNNGLYPQLTDASPISELIGETRERLNFATQRNEVPLVTVGQASVTGIPVDTKAEYRLILENNTVSDTGADSDFLLIVDNTTNPDNAIFNLEPNGTILHVPEGEQTEFLLTLEPGSAEVFDYENIVVRLESLCDGDDVSSEIVISATFIPVCTPVNLQAPLDNWVFNRPTAGFDDGDELTNSQAIRFNGFNVNSSTFDHIDLEFRSATSPNWTRLQTYYRDEARLTMEINDNGADPTSVSHLNNTNQEVNFNWDIVGLNLQDGSYEVRVVSHCTDGSEFISEIARGTVDLNEPRRFETPTPIDGILSAGEDLRVRFNEPIFFNSAISQIEIMGETNQLAVNNDVSVRFADSASEVRIERPNIQNGDLSIEFWMKDDTASFPATLVRQEGGVEIGLNADEIYFTIGNRTVSGGYNRADDLFHHYTFTFSEENQQLAIYRDDRVVASESFDDGVILIANNESIEIGGSNFIGNLHDFRLWGEFITLNRAVANQNAQLIGNEAGLLGYWSMHEGHGPISRDLARFNHAVVNANWDIFPNGNSYEFSATNYLKASGIGSVVLTDQMDATVSFWVRASSGQGGTLLSNGRGNGEDPDQSDGNDNKWAISLNTNGDLVFDSEGRQYDLAINQSVNDGQWHHVALLFNRLGALQTYIDASLVSSNSIENIGGFSGNALWLGARGFVNLANQETIDQHFSGELDEVRIWNSLRSASQIDRDRFNEVDFNTIGLIFNSRFNAPDPTQSGDSTPTFAQRLSTGVISLGTFDIIGNENYSENTPPIRRARNIENFSVSHIINGDEMIIEPLLASEALVEGQILDITVHRMFDAAGNQQLSPITWTAFYERNPIDWFANGFVGETVDATQTLGTSTSFTLTLMNSGGQLQAYEIADIPSWLVLEETAGFIEPNSTIEIEARIDAELSVGEYLDNIRLITDFGFDQNLILDVRVLAEEPEWAVDPNQFDFGMNIIGGIQVDGIRSEDVYDNVAAFVGDEVRGVADLVFDPDFKQYFVFLTVYSNISAGETLTFRIWDASRGQVLEASLDGDASIPFINNQVVGTLSNSALFSNTQNVEQEIHLNSGWTWVSLNTNDPRFSDLNLLTEGLNLATGDRILSHAPAQTDIYEENPNDPSNGEWAGTISANGGLSSSKMYRVRLTEGQTLNLKGQPVDIDEFSFDIQENWNWLPYPIARNVSVNEAMALFSASEGDLIKSQNSFAIYDPDLGWRGTLTSLRSGEGYLIRATQAQNFKYPGALVLSRSARYTATIAKADKASGLDGKLSAKSNVDFAQYSTNMNAILQIPDAFSAIYAYDDKGNLRGEAHRKDVPDSELYFMTLYGNQGDDIYFKLGNADQKVEVKTSVSYTADQLLGSLENPIQLAPETIQGTTEEFKIYPNPFESEVSLNFVAQEAQRLMVYIHDVTGKTVFTKGVEAHKGTNSIPIYPQLPSGVYFLKTTVDNTPITIKLIKN